MLVNTTVFEGGFDPVELRVVEIPATDLAVELGNIMTASMVMLGAYVAASPAWSSFDALDAAVAESLPPYRTQHVALNVAALAAGRDAVPDARRARMAAKRCAA